MFIRAAAIFLAISFAVSILAISIFRLSTPNYAFYVPSSGESQEFFSTDIGYFFPSPGLGPDSPLWFAKAMRDKVWLTFSFGHQKRARILLLFADKRVIMSEDLMKKGESALAVVTAEKAEQYLLDAYQEMEKAEKEGKDMTDLITTLAKASLRHRETLEYETTIAPQDAVPMLVKVINTPKSVYRNCTQKLIQTGKFVPKDEDTSQKNN